MAVINPIKVPLDELRRLLSYDPLTGLFVWRVNRSSNARAGKVAGSLARGYVCIHVGGTKCQAHRLAWYLHYSADPYPLEVDHIDGDPSNNRINNLRLVSRPVQCRNSAVQSNNPWGLPGITWRRDCLNWEASIGRGSRYLGRFADIEDALAARTKAERDLGYHTNHGRHPRPLQDRIADARAFQEAEQAKRPPPSRKLSAALSDIDVSYIQARLENNYAAARRFGVDETSIRRIRQGKTAWANQAAQRIADLVDELAA